MENYTIVIFILSVMICLSAVASKIKMPYPILLIIAGIAIGFIPTLPNVELRPDIVFLIFLPPMLYDSAFNLSFRDFRINFNTIGTLSISLVFITVAGIAVFAHYYIPGMTWPLSFLLGAILSATDAVAAMSVTKGLGLPHKTIAILEGESLINDASALVAYRFSVAAVSGTAFIAWQASLNFVFLLAGGFFTGIVIGKVLSFVLRQLKNNPPVAISFMLLMPFVTYLIAEELHVSGVIAVVTLGLVISRYTSMIFPESLRKESKTIWDILVFLLNGLVFILIGLQFPYVVNKIDPDKRLVYTGYAFVICLIALALRTTRVFMQQVNLDKAFQTGKRRISQAALLDFKNSVVISWSGMRGIVSLAIAMGLPFTTTDGQPFPERNALIFISVVVVLFTLIGQGLSLPWIVRTLKIEKQEPH